MATRKTKPAEDATQQAELAARSPVPLAEKDDPNMELVSLRLPLNPANPRDTEVTVGLNGRFWMIQRGHTVQVPRAVSEIVEHSERQTAAAMEYITGVARAQA